MLKQCCNKYFSENERGARIGVNANALVDMEKTNAFSGCIFIAQKIVLLYTLTIFAFFRTFSFMDTSKDILFEKSQM